MLAALAADTARHIRRVRAVLEVVSTGSRKGGLKLVDHSSLVLASQTPD